MSLLRIACRCFALGHFLVLVKKFTTVSSLSFIESLVERGRGCEHISEQISYRLEILILIIYYLCMALELHSLLDPHHVGGDFIYGGAGPDINSLCHNYLRSRKAIVVVVIFFNFL
jgi:hypothetical protein